MFENLRKERIKLIFFLFFSLNSTSYGLAGSYTPPPSSSLSLLRVVISFIMVLVIFYIIVFFLKFFFIKKGLLTGKKRLKLIDILHTGPNLSLYLIETKEKNLLIAANSNHIALLQEYEKDNENSEEIPQEETIFKDFLNKLGFNKGDKKCITQDQKTKI